MVWGYLFTPLAEGLAVPDLQISIFQWAAVSSWGLASACFSFYRTLDGDAFDQVRPLIRIAGTRLINTSVLLLLALVWSVGMRSAYALEHDRQVRKYSSMPVL